MIFENINRLCSQRGLTIAALEKMSGLNNATICKWKDSIPRVDTLKKVADALGVTVDDLLRKDIDEDRA